MARLGRSFPATRCVSIRAALRTQSVTVVLGTEESDGLLMRVGLARAPNVNISVIDGELITILTGVQAASVVGAFNLSVTGLATLLTGVSSSATVTTGDAFTFTGLVTSGKWEQDKTKKNIPRRRWGRQTNFDNKNFEAGEDFVEVIDQYGQFRISTVTRDRIVISSLQSISDNLGNQGRP